jgi:hypothetical protein
MSADTSPAVLWNRMFFMNPDQARHESFFHHKCVSLEMDSAIICMILCSIATRGLITSKPTLTTLSSTFFFF